MVINIGVLGCANIANRSVIPAILELPHCFKLSGIASRTSEKAATYAERFQTKPFDSYQALIDSKDLHAVYIPLPNALHGEWIEKALYRSLNVLVEKSMACEYQDVIWLNELAKERKLVLVENFQFRFHSQLEFIRNLVEQGTIGELRCIRSSFGFPGLPDENDIRYKKELGGGALLDACAYPLKVAQIFLGLDIEVRAANLNYLPGKSVDIWGGAYLKQKHGKMFGELAFGFDNFYQCSLELWGTKGKLFTNRIFTAGNNHEPLIEVENQTGKQIITLPVDNHFKNMLLHFHNLIAKPENLEEEFRQNVNQSRLIYEIKLKSNE